MNCSANFSIGHLIFLQWRIQASYVLFTSVCKCVCDIGACVRVIRAYEFVLCVCVCDCVCDYVSECVCVCVCVLVVCSR